MKGLGLRGLGFRVEGLGLRVWGLGLRVEGLGCIKSLGLWVLRFGSMIKENPEETKIETHEPYNSLEEQTNRPALAQWLMALGCS